MSSIWDDVGTQVVQAKPQTNRGVKVGVKDGSPVESRHKLEITAVREGKGGEASTTPYIMWCFKVLESDLHEVGDDVVISVWLDKPWKMQNAKSYFTAMLGHDPSLEEMRAATSQEQPHVGTVIVVHTQPKTSKAGNLYATHLWSLQEGTVPTTTTPPATTFPPEGWWANPNDPGCYYNRSGENLDEASLRARVGA